MGALLPWSAFALEVDREVLPRITIGGRVIGTLDLVDVDSDPATKHSINSEDSNISVRMDKRLYGEGVAGAVLGFREDGDLVHFGDHYVFFWNQSFDFKLGHAPLRNTLIEFPTLRDDDFIEATHVGNASSNANFEQTHGDVVSVDWYVDGHRHAVGAWAASRGDEPGLGVAGVDSGGIGYVYQVPDALRYVERLRHAGVLLDRQMVKNGTTEQGMNAWIAGVAFNVNNNALSNWSLQAQTIAVEGVGTPELLTTAGRARAASRSLVTALTYTARPALLTRWEAALTLAYTDYADVNDATRWSVAPHAAYRLGEGVDLLAQLRHTRFGSGLGGGSDTVAQLGLAFSLDARFNNTIGERNSILNLEHGAIP